MLAEQFLRDFASKEGIAILKVTSVAALIDQNEDSTRTERSSTNNRQIRKRRPKNRKNWSKNSLIYFSRE